MTTQDLAEKSDRLNDRADYAEYRAHKASKSGRSFFAAGWDRLHQKTLYDFYETRRDYLASKQDDADYAADLRGDEMRLEVRS